MTAKKFPSELNDRGTVLVTDKLLIHNITTGATEYTTVAALQTALSSAGTWTPVLTFGGASVGITYTLQTGQYIKNGDLVTVIAQISLSSKGSSTGNAIIEGLPHAGSVVLFTPVSLYISAVGFSAYPQGFVSGSTITLRESSTAGSRTSLTDEDFNNTSYLLISATYKVA